MAETRRVAGKRPDSKYTSISRTERVSGLKRSDGAQRDHSTSLLKPDFQRVRDLISRNNDSVHTPLSPTDDHQGGVLRTAGSMSMKTCTNDERTFQKAWKTKCRIRYGDALGDILDLGSVDDL